MTLLNRELSWLEFNHRVLQQALDPAVPLLNRLFFLSVTASNLDEFYMVRAGGLHLQIASGITAPDPSGFTPAEQLQRVRLRIRQLIRDQYDCLAHSLLPELAANGIHILPSGAALPDDVTQSLASVFNAEILPLLTPVAVPDAPAKKAKPPAPSPDVAARDAFPTLATLQPYLAVRLEPETPRAPERFALLRLSAPIPRLWRVVSGASTFRYAFIEDILRAFLPSIFPGQRVLEATLFRITRNADLPLDEEFSPDLAFAMTRLLQQRKTAPCVRLETEAAATPQLLAFLTRHLPVQPDDILKIPGALDLTALRSLPSLPPLPGLQHPAWLPQPHPDIDPTQNIFLQIARRNILLHHPYHAFDPVVSLVQTAAKDPHTLAIKIILYRTSPDSRLIPALAAAARAGKLVTVILELKARFDEARNIDGARDLESAGVQVIYGIRHLKTHAKVCLVLRREDTSIRHYLHLGTGNYNESTARLYTDVGLLTASPILGRDASAFFHAITGYSEPQTYQNLTQSPLQLRDRLLTLIRHEAASARKRQPALILAKMNSLADPDLIAALYDASRAGVTIHLCVRGICCLCPGVKGLSETITVTSVIDRLLEHSRIFYFYRNGAEDIFFSSADWMPRNLDRRIELMTHVTDPDCKQQLTAILQTSLADTANAWLLQSNGTYTRVPPHKKNAPVRSQHLFHQAALSSAKLTRRSIRTRFIPHLPDKKP